MSEENMLPSYRIDYDCEKYKSASFQDINGMKY